MVSSLSPANIQNGSVIGVNISTVQNPNSFDEFSQASPFFQVSGEGPACFPLHLASSGVDGIVNGANATLQFIFNGGEGDLYQCADVILSNTVTISSEVSCANGTSGSTASETILRPHTSTSGELTRTANIGYGTQIPVSSRTPSSTTSHSPNDTSHKSRGKTISLCVVSVVVGLLLLILAIMFLIVWRGCKQVKRSAEPRFRITPFQSGEITSAPPNHDEKTAIKKNAGAVSATTSGPSNVLGDPDVGEEPSTMRQLDASSASRAVHDVGNPGRLLVEIGGGSGRRREADAGICLFGDEWVDDNGTLPPAYADIRHRG